MLHQIKAPQFYTDFVFQVLCKFDFQGFFKTVLYIQVLFKPVWTLTLVAYIANTVSPDQTAPKGAVWSGYIVFAAIIKVVTF